MQAMNRFVEYFGAYMDEAGRLALADAAVVGMSTYHDRRELHIELQLPAWSKRRSWSGAQTKLQPKWDWKRRC